MIVPAHRIKKGQYLLPFRVITKSKVVRSSIPSLFGMFGPDSGEYREVDELEVKEYKPWIGGIPWKVLEVSLPVILCQSALYSEIDKPPFLYFDADMTEFILVSVEHVQSYIEAYNTYYKAHKGKIATVATVDISGNQIVQREIIDVEARAKQAVNLMLENITENADEIIRSGDINLD